MWKTLFMEDYFSSLRFEGFRCKIPLLCENPQSQIRDKKQRKIIILAAKNNFQSRSIQDSVEMHYHGGVLLGFL